MQKFHIVLACTARKRASEPGYPRLRNVARAPVSDRVTEWVALVSTAPQRYVAANLYAGEYWQTARKLASRAESTGGTGVFVVSAGLGLVGIDDAVPMYGATLAARHPDSVLASSDPTAPCHVRRQWWDELTRAEVLGRGGPQRLADLAEDGSEALVMVCVGRNYLDAVATDLKDLVGRLGDPDRVMVFASGTPLVGLEDSWVAVSGSLRLVLGGSLSSTNLRAAKAVLAELGTSSPSAGKARRVVASLTASAGKLPTYDRHRQHDDAILDWIHGHLAEVPNATKTAALRCFRDGGKACEQARFDRLFEYSREMST